MSENLENIETIDTTATEQNLDDFEVELFTGKAPEQKPVDNKEVVDDNVNDSTEEENAEETEENLDEEDADGDDQPNDPPKKESRAEKRIRELVAKNRELERKLEEQEAAKKTVETPKETKEQPNDSLPETRAPHWDDVDANGNPKYPLGQFDPQFNADLVRFTINEENRKLEEKRAQTEQQRRAEEAEAKVQAEWESKLAPALERHPDFVEKGQELVDNFSDLDPNYAKYLTDTIRAIDNGPEVLYYLADNPELARDIVNKGAAMATVMLGRISAMFDDESGNKTKETNTAHTKVTNAPTPPPRVRGTALPKTKDLDNLDDFEEALFGRS